MYLSVHGDGPIGGSRFAADVFLALEKSNHAVFVSSYPNTLFVGVNDAACRLLGYARDELLRLGPRDVSARLPQELEAVYAEHSRGTRRRRARGRRSDGSVFEIGYYGWQTDDGFWLVLTDPIGTAGPVGTVQEPGLDVSLEEIPTFRSTRFCATQASTERCPVAARRAQIRRRALDPTQQTHLQPRNSRQT
jgi:PAS domain S-box-containing protein